MTSCVAGLFQPSDSDLVTFHDVVDELRLCFEFPDSGAWDDVAFALIDSPSPHIPEPVRRHERRYLPPKKPSPDPRYAIMPLRKMLKGKSRSASPSKHTVSGSVSPTRDGAADADDEDVTGMVAPPTMTLALDYAKSTAAKFRSSCLQASNICAVSGKGQSWYFSPSVGPALQACHIVEQQHYHLYPNRNVEDDASLADSPRRLQQLWHSTWSAKNGILLLAHLHELFDARLFSIHPDTHRIRAFVPYDVLTEFHSRKAFLPPIVDREALRHHYDMCCIENMAALTPYPEIMSLGIATSGTSTALSARTDFPLTPSPGDASMGDPSKRSRPTQHDEGQSSKQNDTEEALEDEGGGKQRRLDDCRIDDEANHEWAPVRSFDGHITPWNSRQFLADVNWELQKFTAAELA